MPSPDISQRILATGGQPDDRAQVPPASLFDDTQFQPAPDLATIASAMIERHGARFSHLQPVVLLYFWRKAGGKDNGVPCFGKCLLLKGLLQHLTGGATWAIWLAADHCRDSLLTKWQLEALVFHQLLHAGVSEAGSPQFWPHEFAGFGAEISTYGLWNAGLSIAGKAYREAIQPPLWTD